MAGYALVRARGDNDAGAGRLTEVQEHAAAGGAEHGDHEHGRDAQGPGAVHAVHRDVHRPACEDAGWRRRRESQDIHNSVGEGGTDGIWMIKRRPWAQPGKNRRTR